MNHQTEAARKRDLMLMLMALGNIYLEKGIYGKAAQKYQQLLNFKIASKELYVNFSKALINLKKFDNHAVEIYQKALEYDPDNSKLCTVLAATCYNEKRTDSHALKIYEMAVRHKTPILGQLSEFLSSLYFNKGNFADAKRISEKLLQNGSYADKSLEIYVQSSWNCGELEGAITNLKHLLRETENQAPIIHYLCLTFLEKKLTGEIQNQAAQFSALDRKIVSSKISSFGRFDNLRDLSHYLEIKRFITEKRHWEDLIQSSIEEFEYSYAHEQKGEVPAFESRLNPTTFSIKEDFFKRLIPLDFNNDANEYHSHLTFDDFRKEGASIFSQSEDDVGLKLPKDAEVVITIEISNYAQQLALFGAAQIGKIKDKLYLILMEYCRKYRLSHIWTTSNGLIIFSNNVLSAVLFSIGILNRLNRYNFLSDEKEEFHLSIGIHHGRDSFANNDEQTLKDLCTGVKLGIATEKDLPSDSSPRLSNALQKTDRILLTGKAFRQIKSSNRFMMNTLGQVRLKYISEPIGLYEVAWRSPIEDLAFGHIKRLGRYDLLAELKNEGMFRVYKVKDSSLQRLAMLKAIQSEEFNLLQSNNPRKNAFYQMANAFAQMSQPNIATIYEVDEDQGLTYIVREFIEGTPITAVFKNRKELNPTRLMQLVQQICRALQYCHQLGFCHLNLKPNNILVGFYDETKIMDFHIPKSIIEEDYGNEQNLGNISYRAPEQLLGEEGDLRSDIFSLGIILYEIVTGIKLFDDTNLESVKAAMFNREIQQPSKINRHIPEFFDTIILRCLEKNPEKRFQNVNDILAAIRQAFDKGVFSNYSSFIAQSRNS